MADVTAVRTKTNRLDVRDTVLEHVDFTALTTGFAVSHSRPRVASGKRTIYSKV